MFKGEFKFSNASAKAYSYTIGDIVSYQGKFWECTKPTQMSPLQDDTSWKFTGKTQNTISDIPPINPFVGQVWTSSNGTSYTWFDDGNTNQWVET